ncbi:MAG TPA: CheR family methyltransferase [Dongiaceae bacterium]|nr:CheR family methyltransferase [Dongiaceae bacterium]
MAAFGQVSASEPRDLAADRDVIFTRFFDPELDARYLEREIIPAIYRRKKATDQVRVWVMDCGGGEAAYSLAMLLSEANIALRAHLKVTVFATDTDPAKLAAARSGRFDTAIARDAAADRLGRWFVADDDGYTVGKELRSTCIFSIHDLTQDVPFSHMDLICCGNVLWRLSPELQDKAVPLLHFALSAGGYLLPLAGECMARHPKLFELAPGARGTYARLDGGRRFFPAYPLSSHPEVSLDGLSDPAPNAERDTQNHQVHWLQSELRLTKDRLRSTIEQLRAANRNLQFSNEEYQSLNEELRSTNEELQCSKAELQAVNRELGMVNGELSHRIEESRRTNCDLRHLLNSTRISTLFLDRQLQITRFTPAITEIFHVMESDVGRPITDIACELPYDSLPNDVAQAIRTLSVVERKISNPADGGHYFVRVLPYLDADNVVAGAVLTFQDISTIVHAEAALRQSEERFRAVANSVPAALFTADAEMAWTYVNPRFYEFTGLPEGSALAAGWLAAVHAADRDEVERRLARARLYNADFECEFRLRDIARGHRWYFLRATRNPDQADNCAGWTGSLLDTHDRHIAETRQRLLFVELQRRVKTILGTVRSIAGDTKGNSHSLDDFFAHFDGRLNALARAHASIARHADLDVDLEELLSEEILTHAVGFEDRVLLSGPAVRVDERVGQALGLAVHELTTNALKFGALAKSTGRVEVSWTLFAEDDQHIRLEWNERNVAVVDPNPRRVGFGRDFLERRLAAELDASTRLEFQPGGIRFTIDFPPPLTSCP